MQNAQSMTIPTNAPMTAHTAMHDALQWRYATKRFSAEKLPETTVLALLEEVRLSASSFGLEPWQFILVENPEVRQKIRAAAWDQPQVTDASHLIILASRTHLSPEYVRSWTAHAAKERGVPHASFDGFTKMIEGFLEGKDEKTITVWSQKQTYIALGTLLAAGAMRGIDTCPMEGFDPAQVDAILGLPALQLTATALCPIGLRADGDKYAQLKKVRLPMERLLIRR
jgi:nitroreductase